MGDFRCDIKIQIDFLGIQDKCDMWINWDGESGEVEGVDDRVIEFIRKVYNRGIKKHEKALSKQYEEEHKQEIEEREKAELKRLQGKYKGITL